MKNIEEAAVLDKLPRGGILSRSMPLKGLEQFCQRVGIGLRSGVDLLRILDLEKKQGNSQSRLGASNVHSAIRSGHTLAESLAMQEGYYPHMLVQMVSAGESGGRLEEVFLHMAEYYRDLRNARTEFIQRVSWPAMQLGLAILILSGVILLQDFLAQPAVGKDAALQFDASGLGLRGWRGLGILWGFVFFFAGVISVIAFGIWKNWFRSHEVLLPLIRNVPVIGTVFTTLALSRFSMTMAMLLNAGVDAKRVIKESFLSTGNHFYISGRKVAEDEVEAGSSFSHALETSGVMPREFIESMEVGEQSGTETYSMERLAKDYQERARIALKVLANTASTVIWIGIAIFLIFLIIRMFMQYINLLNNAGKM